MPSWMDMARFVVSCGRVRIAATALPAAEVRVTLKGTLPPPMTAHIHVSRATKHAMYPTVVLSRKPSIMVRYLQPSVFQR